MNRQAQRQRAGVEVAREDVEPWRMRELVSVVQRLSLARDLATVQDIVRRAARRLSGADGATFVLREGDLCFYADEDAIEPLWKGRRFPMEVCVSGWVMLHRRPVTVPDIYADARIPHDAYRPTFVKSLVMVPIRTMDPLGAIGAYWADRHAASPADVDVLQALADATAVTMESIRLWDDLEQRVAERTADLASANERLATEVAERKRAEEYVRMLSLTDELTGLHNRRGFVLLAGQALRTAPRSGDPALLVFVDLDGLKAVNDTLGHEQGSTMLVAAAQVLRQCFREADVVARVGGDEFAAFVPHAAEEPETLRERLEAKAAEVNRDARLPAWLELSIGISRADPRAPESLEDLVNRADEAMYIHKRGKALHRVVPATVPAGRAGTRRV